MNEQVYTEVQKLFEFMQTHLRNDSKGNGEEMAFNEIVIDKIIGFVNGNTENLTFSKMAFGYLIGNGDIQIAIGDGTGTLEDVDKDRNLSQTGLSVYVTKNKEDFKIVEGSDNSWVTEEVKAELSNYNIMDKDSKLPKYRTTPFMRSEQDRIYAGNLKDGVILNFFRDPAGIPTVDYYDRQQGAPCLHKTIGGISYVQSPLGLVESIQENFAERLPEIAGYGTKTL